MEKSIGFEINKSYHREEIKTSDSFTEIFQIWVLFEKKSGFDEYQGIVTYGSIYKSTIDRNDVAVVLSRTKRVFE